VLPYVSDFLLFASLEAKAFHVRHRIDKLLDRLGLLRHLTKGFREATLFGHHVGFNITSITWYFFALADKRPKIGT
jgi:hypothetical protein